MRRSIRRESLIAQSQAQAQFASADFDRARKLGEGVMAASTIEQREMAMKTAQAQLAAAQNALGVAEADRKSRDAERQELLVRIGRTEVKAPVSGIVSRRSARLGASASTSGEPLFRIIEDGAIDLEADVPEQTLARLAVGMPARTEAARRRRRGPGPRPPGEPGGRQGEPHRQGPDRA